MRRSAVRKQKVGSTTWVEWRVFEHTSDVVDVREE